MNEFIERCKVEGLRKAFETGGFVSEKPTFGEQTWFVSSDNPILRFFPHEGFQHEYELPILFEKISNRFEPEVEEEFCLIVYDHYLKLRWWTLGLKKTTFDEANAYAKEISLQQREAWRLPSVEEMATLLTRFRINRKHMDEKVFPRGRWFWTSSCIGQMVYYVDYNYLEGSIRREDLTLLKENFDVLRKKSVILVSSAPAGKAPDLPVQQTQTSISKPKRGEMSMDPLSIPILLKTVDFLFDEVSKILTERREKRKAQADASQETEPKKAEMKTTAASPVTEKKELLLSPISEPVWLEKQKEIEHLNKVLHTYTQNYYLAKEQIAMWGRATVPPIKMNELLDAEAGIVENTQKLEKALSKVFGKEVLIEDTMEE